MTRPTSPVTRPVPAVPDPTPRLRLRPVDIDRDLADLYAMYSDPVVMTHIGGEAHRATSPEQTRERVTGRVAAYGCDGRGMWAIERRDDGDLVGLAVLRDMEEAALEKVPHARVPGPMVELGYHLRRPHWGHGYASEIAAGLVRHSFEGIGLDVVHATVAPANAASKRVLAKLGMTYVLTAVFGVEHELHRLPRSAWRP